jgi:hypothetical protein
MLPKFSEESLNILWIFSFGKRFIGATPFCQLAVFSTCLFINLQLFDLAVLPTYFVSPYRFIK